MFKINIYMKIFIKSLISLFLTFVCFNSFSMTIQYSGLSYVSGNSELQDLYPNTIKVEKDLRELIFSYLKDNEDLNPNLYLGTSDSFKDGTLSLIIAIDSERVVSLYNEITDKCIRTYNLGAQIITFSTQDQQILSIQPHMARKIYLDESENDSCDNLDPQLNKLRFIGDLYFGFDIPSKDYDLYLSLSDDKLITELKKKSLETNEFSKENTFLRPILDKVLSTNPNDFVNTNFFVGIDEINLGKAAIEQLSGQREFKQNHFYTDFFGEFMLEAYKKRVGQEFTKWFSETYDYPLIPYVKGKALGRDIAIKFADSTEVLNLRLPSLDFGFVIKVRGFKKIKLGESKLREAYAWGSFSTIEFHNVGIENITSIKLKNVYSREVNKGDLVDDWDYFDLSLNGTLKGYSDNIKTLDKKWLSESSSMSSKDFKKHANIIKEKLKL